VERCQDGNSNQPHKRRGPVAVLDTLILSVKARTISRKSFAG
jgi:hypothetical protein